MISLEKCKYTDFIQSIIDTRGQWNIPEGKYFEMHHIIPICLGGEGDLENKTFKKRSNHPNCIWLTKEEHFEAHKLLKECFPNNRSLFFAYWCMITKGKNRNNLSEEELKQTLSEYKALSREDINIKLSDSRKRQCDNGEWSPWNKGLTKKTDNRLKIHSELLSEKFKGENNPIHKLKDKEAFKKHRSEAQYKRYAENPGLKTQISNKMKELRKTTSPIWNKGLKGLKSNNYNKICITKDGKNKFIFKEELKLYLKEGWVKGNNLKGREPAVETILSDSILKFNSVTEAAKWLKDYLKSNAKISSLREGIFYSIHTGNKYHKLVWKKCI